METEKYLLPLLPSLRRRKLLGELQIAGIMVASAGFIRGMAFEGTGRAVKYPRVEDGL